MTFFPQFPFPRKKEIERVHLMVPTLFIYFLFQPVKKYYGWKEITYMTEGFWYKGFLLPFVATPQRNNK